MDKVILVCLDNFQDYIINNIKQLTLLKYEIIVIISDNLVSYFDKIGNIKLVKTNELDDYGYDINSSLDRNFRGGFWRLASQRLFYLYSYIKKENITNCFHIENDVMIYSAIYVPDNTKIWLVMDSENRCIPSILFIPTCEILGLLISNYIYDKNDMENLAYFYKNNKNICQKFPIIDTDDNFREYNMIFDGAAIGQYLGGVDPRNTPGDTRGFVNETCIVDYSKYKFVWKFEEIYKPYIVINNNYIPIFNLHIHSKNLNRFSSINPEEAKLIIIIN
jgi:hypothetical protein